MRLALAPGLRAQIESEARAAFPRECCGLIEGVRDGGGFHALALHPARNLADEADRFVIDPAAQFALQRRLRGTDRTVIGCYHSHPNGTAEPSDEDGEGDVLWLIAALDGRKFQGFGVYLRAGGAWRRLSLA